MIICSCNVLSDKQLRKAAEEMRQDPNGRVPTPGAVFRHLGCRPRCGSCFPSVISIIHENASDASHSDASTGSGEPRQLALTKAAG
ncbi:(2Fe-2S)-binding protein [Roseibium aquae]|uniref:(2Fe-2S)-binding protein n=1 Tax=Roseibium aquae TaxID=1323746 RepID=UPI00123CEE32|nr:(2Fe-2S)-binding protein [Roseibium aquae]